MPIRPFAHAVLSSLLVAADCVGASAALVSRNAPPKISLAVYRPAEQALPPQERLREMRAALAGFYKDPALGRKGLLMTLAAQRPLPPSGAEKWLVGRGLFDQAEPGSLLPEGIFEREAAVEAAVRTLKRRSYTLVPKPKIPWLPLPIKESLIRSLAGKSKRNWHMPGWLDEESINAQSDWQRQSEVAAFVLSNRLRSLLNRQVSQEPVYLGAAWIHNHMVNPHRHTDYSYYTALITLVGEGTDYEDEKGVWRRARPGQLLIISGDERTRKRSIPGTEHSSPSSSGSRVLVKLHFAAD